MAAPVITEAAEIAAADGDAEEAGTAKEGEPVSISAETAEIASRATETPGRIVPIGSEGDAVMFSRDGTTPIVEFHAADKTIVDLTALDEDSALGLREDGTSPAGTDAVAVKYSKSPTALSNSNAESVVGKAS